MAAYRFAGLLSITGLIVAIAHVGCSSTTSTGEGAEEPFPDPYGIEGDDPGTGGDTEPGGEGEGEGETDPGIDSGSSGSSEPGVGMPGRLRVRVKAPGVSGCAKIRVLRDGGGVAGEGPSSQTFEVPSGTYEVEATLEDALDRPIKRAHDVRVRAGDETEVEIAFVVGHLTLQPMRGRRKTGKQIRWRYMGGGDWFEETSMAGQEVVLSAGRYDAEVMVSRRAITISDIQVYEGKRTLNPQVHMR